MLDKVGHSLFSVLLKHLFSSRIALSLTDSRSPLAAPFFCTILKTLIVPRVPFYILFSSYPLYSALLIISNMIYDLCAIYSQILIIVFHFSIEFQIYIHKFIFFIHFKLSKAQTDSNSALYPQIHHVLINTLKQLCFQFSEIHIWLVDKHRWLSLSNIAKSLHCFPGTQHYQQHLIFPWITPTTSNLL